MQEHKPHRSAALAGGAMTPPSGVITD